MRIFIGVLAAGDVLVAGDGNVRVLAAAYITLSSLLMDPKLDCRKLWYMHMVLSQQVLLCSMTVHYQPKLRTKITSK